MGISLRYIVSLRFEKKMSLGVLKEVKLNKDLFICVVIVGWWSLNFNIGKFLLFKVVIILEFCYLNFVNWIE